MPKNFHAVVTKARLVKEARATESFNPLSDGGEKKFGPMEEQRIVVFVEGE